MQIFVRPKVEPGTFRHCVGVIRSIYRTVCVLRRFHSTTTFGASGDGFGWEVAADEFGGTDGLCKQWFGGSAVFRVEVRAARRRTRAPMARAPTSARSRRPVVRGIPTCDVQVLPH
jgi:hypothetical protein